MALAIINMKVSEDIIADIRLLQGSVLIKFHYVNADSFSDVF